MAVPLHQLSWQRQAQPVLSGMTTRQSWSDVMLYNPTVVKHDGRFLMWYVGNCTRSRNDDCAIGFATSDDGIHFTEHPGNPVLRGADIPAELRQNKPITLHTPHVMYDAATGGFRMWMSAARFDRDATGHFKTWTHIVIHATSDDGVAWQVDNHLLYPLGRRPCVIQEGPGRYRMWMNAPRVVENATFDDLVASIYGFTSSDGMTWERDAESAVTAGGPRLSVVYPFVMQREGVYTMWYGCHVTGGFFEIYCSTSNNGQTWTHHREKAAFPATRNGNHFDGRYTSTPCVIDDGDRYLLYYSARDMGNLYGASDGTIAFDGSGIYRHIGVAIGEK